MLLPSTLDCAPRIQPPTSSYLPATSRLATTTSSCQSPASPISSNIYSTCRALQSLLATSIPTPPAVSRASHARPVLASPIALSAPPRAKTITSPPMTPRYARNTRFQPQTPPRVSRKRQRSLSDDDGSAHDQENVDVSKPSTPKRQRRFPPTIPLGLERADFDALQSAHTPAQTEDTQPPQPSQEEEEEDSEWSSADDSALVSLILQKLRLRQSDWDDCARRLGKGKDSIGERWRVLVGDGEVGLRRGSGARTRGNVQEMEFGGPLVPR